MAAKPKRAGYFAGLLRELPAGFVPLESVIVIKCLDKLGNVCLFTHKTSDLAVWEAYGMLCYAADDYASSNVYQTSEDE